MSLLPVEPAWSLADRAEDQRWLVTGLWSEQAVGIIGGEPKCCKSFLALDLAVAVAAGVPCLRRFAVPRAGRVLLYAAEDALHIVRRRLDGICAAAGLGLADLDVQVITAPAVRLDLEADRRSLDVTVAEWRPRLLVLDPFVRLHRIAQRANALALEVIEPRTPQTPTPSSIDERITAALTDVNRPLPFAELRARCRVRTATLYERLAALTAAGRLGKSDQGYRLAGR